MIKDQGMQSTLNGSAMKSHDCHEPGLNVLREPEPNSEILVIFFPAKGHSESTGRGPGDAKAVTTHRPNSNPRSGRKEERDRGQIKQTLACSGPAAPRWTTVRRWGSAAARHVSGRRRQRRVATVPCGVGLGGGERAPPRVSRTAGDRLG